MKAISGSRVFVDITIWRGVIMLIYDHKTSLLTFYENGKVTAIVNSQNYYESLFDYVKKCDNNGLGKRLEWMNKVITT